MKKYYDSKPVYQILSNSSTGQRQILQSTTAKNATCPSYHRRVAFSQEQLLHSGPLTSSTVPNRRPRADDPPDPPGPGPLPPPLPRLIPQPLIAAVFILLGPPRPWA